MYILGIIPIIWVAILIAPYIDKGLIGIINNFTEISSNPFNIIWCKNSIKTIIILVCIYIFAISIYESTKKNYRRREEHGSAKWGIANVINKKYMQKPLKNNKILTQNVAIGLNGRKHRRNLNVLICGRKSVQVRLDFIGKPNVMQCGDSSYVILDPKAEILRDTGNLLEKKGYEVRVLDLINMEKSHCYNPFKYLRTDNDVQRLVTNIFKSTTPKGSQSQDPFWGATCCSLKRTA